MTDEGLEAVLPEVASFLGVSVARSNPIDGRAVWTGGDGGSVVAFRTGDTLLFVSVARTPKDLPGMAEIADYREPLTA